MSVTLQFNNLRYHSQSRAC